MRSSSSSQRALSSSSSEGASRGSGARAAMSESVMRESAPPSRSRRRQPETAAAVTPASAARSAARSPASSRATSSIFLSKGKYTAFLRGGGATPAAFAQFTTAVRLQPASSAASVRLNPAATASTASSLVSNGYMRTPIRTPECPTFCPHPHINDLRFANICLERSPRAHPTFSAILFIAENHFCGVFTSGEEPTCENDRLEAGFSLSLLYHPARPAADASPNPNPHPRPTPQIKSVQLANSKRSNSLS